jgi:DNA-binding XRE family transcriptional regulator|tara:strand:- start:7317 stop:7568 length:252 start_codon:yes stop_codon:yes gene_type:complete
MTDTAVQTNLEAVRAWKKKCPVVLWRTEHGATQMELAALLGVTFRSVQNWEGGSIFPRDSMDEIGVATGITEFTYREWWEAKP